MREGGLQKAVERREACNSRGWGEPGTEQPLPSRGWRDAGKGKLQRTPCPQGPRSHLRKDGEAGTLRKSLRVGGLAEDRVPQSTAELELERSWRGGLTGAAPSLEEMSEWGLVLDRRGWGLRPYTILNDMLKT